jgi:molecular chaperone HtpG
MLQKNPKVAQMSKAIAGRVIAELEALAAKEEATLSKSGAGEAEKAEDKPSEDDKADEAKADDSRTYARIWEAFGRVIKEGIYEDPARREQLLGLARFTTTKGDGRSLKQYVADLRPNQTEIYYLVGDGLDRLKSNPKLEAARAHGIEVLLLTDPVDAFWTAAPLDVGGKPLKSLSQGDIDFGLIPLVEDGSKETQPADDVDEAAVIAVTKTALGDRVSDVRASRRLTDSAACLVATGQGPDRELERLLARHNRGAGAKPILEINMRHGLVKALARAKGEARDGDIADIAELLFDEARILDGEVPDDPAAFTGRLNRLVMRGLPGAG